MHVYSLLPADVISFGRVANSPINFHIIEENLKSIFTPYFYFSFIQKTNWWKGYFSKSAGMRSSNMWWRHNYIILLGINRNIIWKYKKVCSIKFTVLLFSNLLWYFYLCGANICTLLVDRWLFLKLSNWLPMYYGHFTIFGLWWGAIILKIVVWCVTFFDVIMIWHVTIKHT